MFVKTHKDQYVNTDHIEVIKPDRDTGQWKVYFTSCNIGTLPEEAALYLLSVVEADNGFVPGAEIEKVSKDIPLTTIVAQTLRYGFIHGAVVADLAEHTYTDKVEVAQALSSLIIEGVVKTDNEGLYYHVDHFPVTASPDLSTEAAAPTDTSEEHSAQKADPKSDG